MLHVSSESIEVVNNLAPLSTRTSDASLNQLAVLNIIYLKRTDQRIAKWWNNFNKLTNQNLNHKKFAEILFFIFCNFSTTVFKEILLHEIAINFKHAL